VIVKKRPDAATLLFVVIVFVLAVASLIAAVMLT
jgi:hypothetical protein